MLLLSIAVGSELYIHSRGACHFPGHFPSSKLPSEAQSNTGSCTVPRKHSTSSTSHGSHDRAMCSMVRVGGMFMGDKEGSVVLMKVRKKAKAEPVGTTQAGPQCCSPAQLSLFSEHPSSAAPSHRSQCPLAQPARGTGVGPGRAPGMHCMTEVTTFKAKNGRQGDTAALSTFWGQSHQARVHVLVCPAPGCRSQQHPAAAREPHIPTELSTHEHIS